MKAQLLRQFAGYSGQIFTVDYVDENGQHKMVNGRLDVKRYMKSQDVTSTPESSKVMHIFDMQALEYKAVPTSAIFAVRCHKFAMVDNA